MPLTIEEFSETAQVDMGEHFTLQVIAVRFVHTAAETQILLN
ncbi:hypothetical protein [Stieleria neptunia]|nr:hypothetical protein [Stieleria neptunia]